MSMWLRGFCAFSLVLAACRPALAAPDQGKHCPASTPANTFNFFVPGARTEDDKARLDTLAEAIARQQNPVCILAFGEGYSKKLAIRRILWIKDNLIAKGVSGGLIAAELRSAQPDQDKDSLRRVSVIVGR